MEQPGAPLADPAPTAASEPEPIVIDSGLTPEDWDAWVAAWQVDARARIGSVRLLAAIVLPVVAGVLFVTVGRADLRALPPFLIGAATWYFAVSISQRLSRRVSRPDPNGFHLGRIRMELSPQGIRTERAQGSGLTLWPALQRVTRTRAHLFLWIDALTAYIVPLRDLPEGVTADDLVARVRAFAGSAAPLQRDPEPVPSPALGFAGALWRRLLWRAVPGSGASSDAVIACSALLALAVWLAFDRSQASEGAEWYPGGAAGGLAWYALGVLLVAWVTHRGTSNEAPWRSVLAAIAGALPLVLVLGLSIQRWVPLSGRIAGYVLLALLVAWHLHRALVATTGRTQLRALGVAVLSAALLGWATREAWIDPTFWYGGFSEEDSEDDPIADETLLFEQKGRIDAAAARLAPGRPGRADVFFLGFAGYGEQKVFAQELALAEGVVARRYGAADRSLLLVNDPRDRDAWPLATVPGLRHALTRVAARMDPDEDVLFLMLTSHGADDASLSVANGSLSLSDLDGEELKDSLDASGIRWRVIVISACYSGAFIDLLADDHTILLTSAAADRTSFGCGDDDEVTEFGAAFIRDALPAAASLGAAFEAAKVVIAERERAAKLTPSSPQARFGGAIEPYWAKIEAEHAASPSVR
jgi:hypothetical protein